MANGQWMSPLSSIERGIRVRRNLEDVRTMMQDRENLRVAKAALAAANQETDADYNENVKPHWVALDKLQQEELETPGKHTRAMMVQFSRLQAARYQFEQRKEMRLSRVMEAAPNNRELRDSVSMQMVDSAKFLENAARFTQDSWTRLGERDAEEFRQAGELERQRESDKAAMERQQSSNQATLEAARIRAGDTQDIGQNFEDADAIVATLVPTTRLQEVAEELNRTPEDLRAELVEFAAHAIKLKQDPPVQAYLEDLRRKQAEEIQAGGGGEAAPSGGAQIGRYLAGGEAPEFVEGAKELVGKSPPVWAGRQFRDLVRGFQEERAKRRADPLEGAVEASGGRAFGKDAMKDVLPYGP